MLIYMHIYIKLWLSQLIRKCKHALAGACVFINVYIHTCIDTDD